MKTTELYIEQVLIGLLIIAIGALPWSHQLSPRLGNSLPKLIAEASFLLGVGFWVGIPFDRFADTLLERLEHHNRLQFALKNAIGKELIKQDSVKLTKDIYPEDRRRLKGWRDEEGVVNWLEYNRSRIRLTRALAVYGPALTFSLTVAVSPDLYGKPSGTKCLWLSLVAVVYFAWAMLASPPSPLQPNKVKKRRIIHAVFGDKLPRTDEVELIEYGQKWDRVTKNDGEESTNFVKKSSRSDLFVWADEWRVLAIPLLLLIATIWIGFRHGFPANWVAWLGASLTVIASWSWWRISYTYRTYLSELELCEAS